MFRNPFHAFLLVSLATIAASCSREEKASASDAEIGAHLQQLARQLNADLVDLRLTDLRFSPDRSVVCGFVRVPGKAPEVFSSVDLTPENVDRPIGLPFPMKAASAREQEIRNRSIALNESICERNNLMPQGVG